MYHPPAFEPSRDEMMAILEEHIPFLDRAEPVPVREADGRIAARDLTAPYPLPNRASGSCDGIAVCFDAFAGGMPDTSAWKEGLEFVYSNTGNAIPERFDTVIPIEEVELREGGSSCALSPRKGARRYGPPAATWPRERSWPAGGRC